MDFLDYLDKKPLYYTEIDYERMPRVYEKIKNQFEVSNVIHLIGTNGKGTTGRFLASALQKLGNQVGHYTSPHILEFNERIWLSGSNATNQQIQEAHELLQTLLSQEDADSLSYFEYTTFLAMLIFQKCDYIVLEAGLGGEHDATAVFDKCLTLVTPIAFDHEAFLGSTIMEIAQTKLNAIQNNAILAKQRYEDVYNVANRLTNKKIYNVDDLIDEEDVKKIEIVAKNLSLASYLVDNLKLSIAALKFLGLEYNEGDFKDAQLFGRLSRFKKNILLDVGHNVLAATSILKALSPKKYIVIYNSYHDKDYRNILIILKPIIKHLEIININDERIESPDLLQKTLNDIEIEYKQYKVIQPDEEYLVFGSFRVVEEFLKGYSE